MFPLPIDLIKPLMGAVESALPQVAAAEPGALPKGNGIGQLAPATAEHVTQPR